MNIKTQTQSELISSSVVFLLNSFILDNFFEQSTNKNDLKRNLILIVAQIFELIGLATYKINSGDRPEFFIRINNESELVKMTNLFMIRVR